MTQLKNKIRFVHHNVTGSGETSFTAAYHRDESYVFFAWTELYHKDEYVKQIGREVSTTLLMSSLVDIQNCIEEHNETIVEPMVLSDRYVGIIPVEHFKHIVSNVITDNELDKMDLMSFKHAFVSHVVRLLIQSKIG